VLRQESVPKFKPYRKDQLHLLPACLEDYVLKGQAGIKGDVRSNTTLYCKRKDLNRSSLARIQVQTEIDIAEWEE
jgi:hypothetical protein